MDPLTATREWLASFAAAVRARDFAAGRELCAPEVEGFGTVTGRYVGLVDLEADQWRSVWPRTRDFAFDLERATVWTVGDQSTAIVEWSSQGIDPDGSTHPRSGRATVVVQHDADRTVAVHTHFSMTPGSRA
ncbi:YybH family protein [Aeromicrobium sp. UC242_57]|uniref:YybH family protein n=1 Tax=Aeromicrobium sp. UC242_57 TaxID=3374624 RepID=UPI0037BC937E